MDYTDLIPFEKELEHIENYLYIQNTRFGNALVFEKDITVTEFQIPPLSVQPLIENAINTASAKMAITAQSGWRRNKLLKASVFW